MVIERLVSKKGFNINKIIKNDKEFLLDSLNGVIIKSNSLFEKILMSSIDTSSFDKNSFITDLNSKEDFDKQYIYFNKLRENGIFVRKNIKPKQNLINSSMISKGEVIVNLWLNVSNSCNMNCKYCFENGGNYGNKNYIMSKGNCKKCIDFWFERLNKKAKNIMVVFFGGEPLLNKATIMFAVNYINELTKNLPGKITYTITTNGTMLDEEFINFLVSNNVWITISIDGGEQIHNKNRPLKSGEPSFEIVKANINLLKKKRKYLTARVTLLKEDAGQLCNIVNTLWQLGFNQVSYDLVSSENPNFNFNVSDIEILKPQIDYLAKKTFENICNAEWQVVRNFTKGITSIHEIKRDIMECSLYSPYTLMFDSSGALFKCQRFMDKNAYCVGSVDRDINFDKFFKSRDDYNEQCLECWAFGYCHGGCSQVNFVNTGSYSNPPAAWCEHTKYIMYHSLNMYLDFYLNRPAIFNSLFR